MEPPIKVFGAKASIHIAYDGDLPSLAARLSTALTHLDFEIGPRETHPHDIMGSAELLGWELWLESTNPIKAFRYSLKMETEHSLEESFNDDMHDLSPWLARYVSSLCDLEVLISGTNAVFSRGKQRVLD